MAKHVGPDQELARMVRRLRRWDMVYRGWNWMLVFAINLAVIGLGAWREWHIWVRP